MRTMGVDLLEWQKRFGTEEACAEALVRQRWPEGFRCTHYRCVVDHGLPDVAQGSHCHGPPGQHLLLA